MFDRAQQAMLHVYRRLPTRGRRLAVRTIAPSYTVGSMCVIERDDGRILLVRHLYRRRWGVPGGLLKRRESAASAGRREVLEEVDLRIELVGEPAVVIDPEAQRVDVVFRARPADGEDPDGVSASSPEIVEVRWFDPSELPELQFETSGALVALARSSRSPQSPPLPDPGR